MKRRFNYTNRKRIALDRISVTLNLINNTAESFDAIVRLDGMDLLDEANLYIEAYHRTDLMRYHFGTVGNITIPKDLNLSHLAHHEKLRFRVLVVDESGERGLILASADRIRPTNEGEGEDQKRPILPVDFRDLGRQVWRMEYDGDEPILLINERIPNIHNLAKSDPRFHLYIYPAVIHDLFTHMIFVDGVDDVDDPAQDWHRNWLTFATRFLPKEDIPEHLSQRDKEFDSQDVLRWIDRLTEEFCSSRSREWLKLLTLEEVG